jgi:hypothetical protein
VRILKAIEEIGRGRPEGEKLNYGAGATAPTVQESGAADVYLFGRPHPYPIRSLFHHTPH